MAENGNRIESFSRLAQVLSVVVGVVISVLSFNETRQKEANARIAEASKREVEAAKPFLELRQQRYLEALRAAAVLASPRDHDTAEVKKAHARFWELYWAELSLVEAPEVEGSMVALGRSLEPNLSPTPQQVATLNLAHTLRDSLLKSWGVTAEKVGVNR
jgi:hypothetical protein